jgi:starvation-inducible DNA-binding protein
MRFPELSVPPTGISIVSQPDRFQEDRMAKNRKIDTPEPTPELATPSDLQTNSARSVADALNGILADSYALYLKTKNFHWHVSGPHFRDYHLMLDDQATQILGTTDAIAERVRKTGGTTLRSIGDIARRQTIRDNDADFVSARDMLAELREDNLSLVATLREAKDIVDEAKDNATSGILDEWTDLAEERAWFLYEASRGA